MLTFNKIIPVVLLCCSQYAVFAQPLTSLDNTWQATSADGTELSERLSRRSREDLAVIPYEWNCAIGGEDSRIIKIAIELRAGLPAYFEVQNAEFLTSRVLSANAGNYHLIGSFYHATCRPKAGRMCGYSMTASLEARIDEHHRGFDFSIPRKGGENTIAPVVIETCSEPGAKSCPPAGKVQGTACKVVNISILKPYHP